MSFAARSLPLNAQNTIPICDGDDDDLYLDLDDHHDDDLDLDDHHDDDLDLDDHHDDGDGDSEDGDHDDNHDHELNQYESYQR